MPYIAEISRQTPSCFLFLIDQSGSMADSFSGEAGKSKAQRLADAVNRLLSELTIRCAKNQKDGVWNYYDVGVIGYGASVGPAWIGSLTGKTLIPIREVADSPGKVEERRRRVEDGAGGTVEETIRFKVWFDPVAGNGTPMGQALGLARSILEPWVKSHPTSFPPIVINITDGEADSDFGTQAEQLRQLCTDDGEVLLFNIHLSSKPSPAVLYCDSEANLTDEFSRMLFQASSVLPQHISDAAKKEGYNVGAMSRGFAFNADIVEVIKFLDIGTRAKSMR